MSIPMAQVTAAYSNQLRLKQGSKRKAVQEAPSDHVSKVATLSDDNIQEVCTIRSSDSITAPLQFIGGGGGQQYQIRGWEEGKVITKIRVHSGPSQIKAITLWLTDSNGVTYGKPENTDYREYVFRDGERVTKMSLWGNGAGTRAGWLYFETSMGGSFDYGMYSWGRKQEYPVDVSSGILVGAIMNAGDDIDALGFFFLNPIDYTELTYVKYPTLDFDAQGIAPESLASFKDHNTDTIPRKFSFEREVALSTETSWTISAGLTLHATVTVSAGIPLIAEVEGNFGWEVGLTTTHETRESSETSIAWMISGIVKPEQTISLKAMTREGRLNVPYEGSMMVYLKNGRQFSYPMRGTYKGVTFTGIEITNA